jgi:succinate dehydrogenase / fumarate reductase iron-sulfur subunit
MYHLKSQKRVVRVFRYDPTLGGKGHFDRFELKIENITTTTILDLLIRIQREHDPTLAFRYACRVNMCGSCGMVINGKERLACKTNVSHLPPKKDITIRPLNHFPVIKDLVVDMKPFFGKLEASLTYFDPKEVLPEPVIISPESNERKAIGLSTECISCGCCVSACTMINYHGDYLGPAALNRAFTLLLDSRDGLYDKRMDCVLGSCYFCRTEFNCTEVCPKSISPTRAIKHIQRLALKQISRSGEGKKLQIDRSSSQEIPEDMTRRSFLRGAIYGLGSLTALCLGWIVTSATIGPAMRSRPAQWVRVGNIDKLPPGKVSTVYPRYEVQDGFYTQKKVMPVLISRMDANNIIVFSATCTHLGCTVHWDEKKRLFIPNYA